MFLLKKSIMFFTQQKQTKDMTSLKLEKSEKCFGGWQLIYSHERYYKYFGFLLLNFGAFFL